MATMHPHPRRPTSAIPPLHPRQRRNHGTPVSGPHHRPPHIRRNECQHRNNSTHDCRRPYYSLHLSSSLRSLLGMDTRRTLPFMFASTLPRHHTTASTRHSPGPPATAGRKSTHAQTAPPPIPAPLPQDKIGRYNSLPHCARGHCPTHENFCQEFFIGNYGRPPYLTGGPSFLP